MIHRLIRAAIIAVALVIALLVGGGLYLIDYALCPRQAERQAASLDDADATYPGLRSWHDSLRAVGVLRDTVLDADGTRLHALYAAADSADGTALIVHGYTDNALRILMLGRMYRDSLRYNILLPDLRCHGASGGAAIQMGWQDRHDVLRWIAAARAAFGDTAMVLHGISMGAATVLMTAGEALPPCVRAVVADCGYTSVWEQFRRELRVQFGLPAFPLLYVASALCRLRYGWSFGEASALRQTARNTLPTFFIHGDSDDYVPTAMVYELYAAKPDNQKALWIVAATDHAHAYRNHPKEYTARVRAFLATAMRTRENPL